MSSCRRRAIGIALLLLSPGCVPGSKGPARLSPPAGSGSRPGASSASSANAAPSAPRAKTAATPDPPGNPPDRGTSAEPSGTAPAGPDALVGQAEANANRGNLDEAIRLLERALAAEPAHRKALFLLARIDQIRASDLERPEAPSLYLRAAVAIRKLCDTYKDLNPAERELRAVALYNEACTYAVQGQSDKALDTLAESIDAGFVNAEQIAVDEDFEKIRKSPRFAELARNVEQKARTLAGDIARRLAAQTSPFSFRFALPDLGGKTVTLDDVKGKVTIVDLWGTWCPPCRREIPHLKELLAKYRDHGLAIVGLNYERVADEDVRDTVKAFVREHAVPYPCLIGDEKTLEQIPDFNGYPTLLFLDRSGTVRLRVEGYLPYLNLEAFVTLLLGEAPKPGGGGRSPADPPSRAEAPRAGD
jgi:thiol-disulfide isomerase/thioredoxin